jgi:hypothetical protein
VLPSLLSGIGFVSSQSGSSDFSSDAIFSAYITEVIIDNGLINTPILNKQREKMQILSIEEEHINNL